MTSTERQHVKSQLIEAGFWNSSEPADPTTDINAAEVLERQVFDKTGKRMIGFNSVRAGAGASSMNSIAVCLGEKVLLRVTGNNYPEAICFAAIAIAAMSEG
jgi:hypothetical protein